MLRRRGSVPQFRAAGLAGAYSPPLPRATYTRPPPVIGWTLRGRAVLPALMPPLALGPFHDHFHRHGVGTTWSV